MASISSGAEAARSPVAASWLRCVSKYKLDPTSRRTETYRDSGRLGRQIDALGHLVRLAEPRLDDLSRLLCHTGRAIYLTDGDGLIVLERMRQGDEAMFHGAGLAPGADWSEASQGTNGIGTCLAEGRPVIIHRDQHFLPQNIGMSCIDAPVYGPQGLLAAALDVSSARADDTDGFNQLIAAMLAKVAAQIETDLFRDAHVGHRIVLLGGNEAAPALVAVDRNDVVIGATRAARRLHGLAATGQLRPVPLRDLSGENALGLRGAERAALVRALTRAGGNASVAARDLGIGRATLYRRMKRLGLEGRARDLSRF
jgi:transcriptional regulator of acetoin/glycerol metabolism